MTRLFGADSKQTRRLGSAEENGCGKMADFTLKALEEIRQMGCTHVWYTGLLEHATQTDYSAYGIDRDHEAVVKGRAGSPYAVKDYYDVDPDLAVHVPLRMKEFDNLVRRTHRVGLKVVMDFVPNHVARQYHSDAKPAGVKDLGADDDCLMAFSPQNNFYYIPGQQFAPQFHLHDHEGREYIEMPAKVTGNDCFTASPGKNDWYETVKLNYGIDYMGGRSEHFDPQPDTWQKMLQILLFWADKGVDAFRCDMAEMVPCAFWHWVIAQVKAQHPQVQFIAEVYNPNEYRNYLYHGGFDYLYDKVGLYDTLRQVVSGESASRITQAWQQVDDIHTHMLNFLENHDEQRLASDFFAGNAEKGRPALLVSALMRQNPFMLYFGQELGERGMDEEGFSGRDGRTTIFDYWTLDTVSRWRNGGKFDGQRLTQEEKELQAYYRRVLQLSNEEVALREGEFFDIMYANYDNPMMNTHRQFAFLRKAEDELIVVVANFSDQPAQSSIRLPQHAFDYLHLPQSFKARKAVDLLTGEKENVVLHPDHLLEVLLPANGGKVLKIKS
jgi:glycosidase